MSLILFHSPKGGVGNSFLAAQLAIQLAHRGHQVTAIDFTFQGALKLNFAILPSQSLANMSRTPGDVTVVHGVELLNGYDLAQERDFREALAAGHAGIFNSQHITIVDVESGDLELKSILYDRCDLHICTLMPQAAALATLPLVVPGTATVALEKTAFVLNSIDDTRRLSRDSNKFVRELLGDALVANVRRDEAVNEALARFEPLTKAAPSSIIHGDVARLAAAVEQRLGRTALQAEDADGGGRRGAAKR
ncbi:cellulose biosynthesis protein BcsQ [Sphingomonas zeicaulis]|uniref:cellulose synthase operon protein YhjQ/BcsQ n=1 Tax=Sphingomonas zeicaulis TaxID=1632740 RepID=UPI003D1C6713